MLKNKIRRIINALGYDIHKINSQPGTLFQIDEWFNKRYSEAQAQTGMALTDNDLRRERHFVLNYLLFNVNLNSGDVCEAGCWQGLSAYQIASFIKKQDIDVVFHIFDSF